MSDTGIPPADILAIALTDLGVTEEDKDIVARTLWGEARGEGEEGMRAVAAVIVNRARIARAWMAKYGKKRHPLFGDGSLKSVCQAKFQFSCWNEGDPNRAKMEALATTDALYLQGRAALEWALTNPDPTLGATHYYSSVIKAPDWTKGATMTVKIGHHLFYKNVK
ncbi:MAG: cell wall hydrolase [Acetobacteraceae bacterium]|nr:cell wall hydrolase [Acetobacteraceae bacterium]MCX7684994.1 cell wall hydrolase [Acetobacteraceae bacterium]MDW8399580.1 cell wall hydrolase [Acetobacteraceae bacterium]